MQIHLNIGVVSHSAGAFLFLLLTVLLLSSWRGKQQGGLLILATLSTAFWLGLLAFQSAYHSLSQELLRGIEIWRSCAWYLFLFSIWIAAHRESAARRAIIKTGASAVVGLCLLLLALGWFSSVLDHPVWVAIRNTQIWGLAGVVLAVIGLAVTEQLYRNTRPPDRARIKLLCLGVGSLYAYDFCLYADALVFAHMDAGIWQARGAAFALTAPLLAVAVARNPQCSVDVFVSRDMVLYTATLLAAGICLLTMGVGAYYLRGQGTGWWQALQYLLLLASGLLLLSLIVSRYFRAWIKVFVNKHFFRQKYNYRGQWLRVINLLSNREDQASLYERAIHAIAEIVECPGGALWMPRDGSVFAPVVHWGIPALDEAWVTSVDSSLVQFLEGREWVLEIGEYVTLPEPHRDLELPEWLPSLPNAWLVVPLIHDERLRGFVVLVQPRIRFALNWEDIDLLKLVGRQTAAYLAQYEAAQALADIRQFETFNRLSAFVIHDLKTLIAQLSLVVSNATRHKHDTAFMDDAIHTIEHSVEKMNRLLLHLRSASPAGHSVAVDLVAVLREVVCARGKQAPKPELEVVDTEVFVDANRDRLASVLGHIIQNAQDATRKDGHVRVALRIAGGRAVVEVKDSGIGMDAAFVRERLFRPFDTTKGLAGMGIGAYESREFLRAHGGDVGVMSTPGKGTVFRLEFPLSVQICAQGRSEWLAAN